MGDDRFSHRPQEPLIDVVLVTGRTMRVPDPESHLLEAALRELGIDVETHPWGGTIPWSTVPLVVVRSPWDYISAHTDFLAWARSVAAVTQLTNPVDVIEWNVHKSYLLDLAQAGVPTVATVLVPRQASDAEQAAALGAFAGAVVVKPAVSVGAIGTLRTIGSSAEASAHLASLVAVGDALVQPFASSVVSAGESSLIYFGGVFSHAVRKIPAAGDFRVQVFHGGSVVVHTPSAGELRVGAAALALTPSPTSYARVDLVPVAGEPAVMELEVIEPQLFLGHHPDAPAVFAQHLAALLNGGA